MKQRERPVFVSFCVLLTKWMNIWCKITNLSPPFYTYAHTNLSPPLSKKVLLVTAICGALTSILIYNYIVRQRGTWNAYLVGYGIIIPICIAFPYVMIPLLEIENKILKFCHISIFPILTMFRCSEAMYGFSPPSVEHSHQTFMLYYANIPHIRFDPKTHVPLKSSWADVKEKLYYFVYELCVVGAVLSFLSPFDYVPWTVEEKGDGVLLLEEVGSLFRWNHILNNLMGASKY
uniref:Uncharacterized protein n=1 Tax=Ditylum brightwellii TaxID=49249 RepID=A0A7S1ZBJ1_9STRA|mmetsp:Transcript_28536/g.42374  ORF Transcript_28536/g.42374 Transcript_28536/m.42374 type:complete len:233 (+) Transcript_28536:347-1045(+)